MLTVEGGWQMQRRFDSLTAKFGFVSLIGLVALLPAGMLESRTPRPAIAPGIYSSVAESARTGDYDGLEVEIGTAGQIETVLCEGWCNSTDRTTYTRRGGSIVYDLHMKTLNPDGRITTDALAVELKPSGGNVLARVKGDTGWRVLKRRARAYGLAIARDTQAAARR